MPEIQRPVGSRFIVQKGSDPPCCAALGRFDFDDIRTKARHEKAGIFGTFIGDFDNSHTGQHAWAGIAQHGAGSGGYFARVDHFAQTPAGRVRASISSNTGFTHSGDS